MLLIFSDLDGTLLDAHYSFADAAIGLEVARTQDVPIILSSSKTRAEIEAIRVAMNNSHPFVSENGGAAVIPPIQIPFGTPYGELTAQLRHASMKSGVPVRGFGDMTIEEAAQRTGLPPTQAALAKQREWDEPFVIDSGHDPAALLHAIEAAGLRWTRGGQFHHISGANDKGMAAQAIKDHLVRLHSNVVTVALGDALNDLELLRFADIPVIVRSAHSQELALALPAARITRLPGPAGWNETVLEILKANRHS